jgi:DNA mismatch repair protein MutS
MVNRSMEVLEKDGGIVFLRRLKEGPTAESYGLHVARLAGLSPAVLERAQQIMERLRDRDAGLRETLPSHNELDNINRFQKPVNVNHDNYVVNKKAPHKALDALIRELSLLEPEKMTPLEALALINEWKRRFAAENPPPASSKPRGGKAADSSPSLFD